MKALKKHAKQKREMERYSNYMASIRMKTYELIHHYLIKHPEILETEKGQRLHDEIVRLYIREREEKRRREDNDADEYQVEESIYESILNVFSQVTVEDHGEEVEKIGELVALML